MPHKAKTAGAEPKFDMTNTDMKLLRAMAMHMEGPPAIDYESLRQTVGYAHAKNAKSALKNLLEKLKKQANAAAANEKGADKAATSEAEDSDEEAAEESPKKSSAKKSTRAKKSKVAEEVVDDVSEEEESAKKVAAKKTPAAKKKAPAKKGVGKTMAPKKASAGGPKPAAKGRGKKATKAEEENDQMEEDAKVDAEDNDAAKDEDEEKMEVDDDATGKSLDSLPAAPKPPAGEPVASQTPPVDDDTGKSPNPLPATPTPFAGKPVAAQRPQTLPATAVMTGPPLYLDINGEVYTYTPYDAHLAQSHGVTLEHYLEWKKYNMNYDDWLDLAPYSL